MEDLCERKIDEEAGEGVRDFKRLKRSSPRGKEVNLTELLLEIRREAKEQSRRGGYKSGG